jgi:hypothetical protein
MTYQNIPFNRNVKGVGAPPNFNTAAQQFADDNVLEVQSQRMPNAQTGRTSQAQPMQPPVQSRAQQRQPARMAPPTPQPLAVVPTLDEEDSDLEYQGSSLQSEITRFKVECGLASRAAVFSLVFAVGYLSKNELPPSSYRYIDLLLSPFLMSIASTAYFVFALHKVRKEIIKVRTEESSIFNALDSLTALSNPFVLVVSYLFVTALFGF